MDVVEAIAWYPRMSKEERSESRAQTEDYGSLRWKKQNKRAWIQYHRVPIQTTPR